MIGLISAGSGLISVVIDTAGCEFRDDKNIAKRAASSSSSASSFFGLLLQQLSTKNKDDSKILNFAATQLTLDLPPFLPSVTESYPTNCVRFQIEIMPSCDKNSCVAFSSFPLETN